MRTVRQILAAVGVGVVLAGCGSQAAAPETVTVTTEVPTTVTVAATRTPSLSAPSTTTPNSTPSSVQSASVGSTQAIGNVGHATLHAVDRAVPPTPGGESGEPRTAIDAEVCLDGPAVQASTVSSSPWVVVDSANGRYSAASSTWDTDPQPQYPVGDSALNAGECVRGWIVMNIPADTQLTSCDTTRATRRRERC